MNDFTVFIIIIVILSLASIPIFRSRKRGIKCIGCAYAKDSACSCDDSFISKHQINWVEEYRKDHKKD